MSDAGATAGPPSSPRVVTDPPHVLPMMLKAALPALPGVNLLPGVARRGSTLPDLALVRHDVPTDPGHVTTYAEVCAFPRKDTLPLPYPHLLAFPLQMAILTDGSFPFPAVGTVHLENSITQHRPIALDEKLQVTARAEDLRTHAKGWVFDMRSTVHSGGELVWEETSTFLRRGPGSEDAGSGMSFDEVPRGRTQWALPGDLGRTYARVSGDHNPIHLYPLTAKALGFPRQIAHGMWSLARCLAAIENRLPDGVRVDAAFKKPVMLPGTVAFGTTRAGGDHAFALTRPRDGAPHLVGRATAL